VVFKKKGEYIQRSRSRRINIHLGVSRDTILNDNLMFWALDSYRK